MIFQINQYFNTLTAEAKFSGTIITEKLISTILVYLFKVSMTWVSMISHGITRI